MTGKKDAKYTTVEGHEIVRDGEYETRSRDKAVVLGFIQNPETATTAIVGFVGDGDNSVLQSWKSSGKLTGKSHEANEAYCFGLDLMRPWVEKKV